MSHDTDCDCNECAQSKLILKQAALIEHLKSDLIQAKMELFHSVTPCQQIEAEQKNYDAYLGMKERAEKAEAALTEAVARTWEEAAKELQDEFPCDCMSIYGRRNYHAQECVKYVYEAWKAKAAEARNERK